MTALGGVGVASAAELPPTVGLSGTALDVNQIGYSKNIEHVSNTPAVGPFAAPGAFGTDIAFQDDKAYVGNYNGFTIYDISDPTAPDDTEPGPVSRLAERHHDLGRPALPVH